MNIIIRNNFNSFIFFQWLVIFKPYFNSNNLIRAFLFHKIKKKKNHHSAVGLGIPVTSQINSKGFPSINSKSFNGFTIAGPTELKFQNFF
jgi:hypothetical protein